jgi:hypothetical protein
MQFLDTLHTSGYIGELRTEMAKAGKPRLNPCFVRGLSRTHFNNQMVDDRTWSHIWAGLLPEGGEPEDMVTVDPSLQEISNNSENGYQIMEFFVDPSGVSDQDIAASCHVGRAEINEKGIEVKGGFQTVVLGSSSDGEYVYDFTFIKDNFGKYHPMLLAQTEDGGSYRPSCIADVNGAVRFSNEHLLTSDQRAEMEIVCNTLAGVNLVKDQGKAEQLKGERATIRFGEVEKRPNKFLEPLRRRSTSRRDK